MVGFAVVSLAGIWLERYLEVIPAINHGAGPAISVPEIGTALFFGGLFFLSRAWFARRYPIISPRLAPDALEREQHYRPGASPSHPTPLRLPPPRLPGV